MTTTATLEISPTSKRPTAKEAALRATGGAAQYTTVGHDPYRFAGRRRMTTRQNAPRRTQTHRTPTPSGRRRTRTRARLRRSERHTERAEAFAVSSADVPC